MDLDELYMFDVNPDKTNSTLYSILYKHLVSQRVLEDISLKKFMEMLFCDFHSSALLTRASEGNPRDFISILNECIIHLEGQHSQDGEVPWIDAQMIYRAAKTWYNKDKKYNLSVLQQKFLSELINWVVYKNKTRGFVIDEKYLNTPAFKGLYDARVLHIAQEDVDCSSSFNNHVLAVLDFGTYSNHLMKKNSIHLFSTNEKFENTIFSQFTPSKYDDIIKPFDEQRYFKYCLLDPELNPNICPTYFKLVKQERDEQN